MRENRTHGSEGGDGEAVPDPYLKERSRRRGNFAIISFGAERSRDGHSTFPLLQNFLRHRDEGAHLGRDESLRGVDEGEDYRRAMPIG